MPSLYIASICGTHVICSTPNLPIHFSLIPNIRKSEQHDVNQYFFIVFLLLSLTGTYLFHPESHLKTDLL